MTKTRSRLAASALAIMLAGTVGPQLVHANAISDENALTGNPPSEWEVSGAGDASIQGFGTEISVKPTETIGFKIKTDATDYRIDIYRLGYYAGLGARLVESIEPSAALPQIQPACFSDGGTRLLDCGTWALSASWTVPANAVSGIYLAKLVREDPEDGRASHIAFVVRDDEGASDILFQTSDTTWQAYNTYAEGTLFGGNSLYGGPGGKATKVSYNRPFVTRGTPTEDWLFNAEYPLLRWLERNGYDVSYTTDVDTDRRGAELLEHRVFVSIGHDEYWSRGAREAVEAARDAGVHLCFMSGNEVYWKVRWEPSADGAGTPYRTLVCYKEGTLGELACGGRCDPEPGVWTGLWRDGCNEVGVDGCEPENALSGQISWVGSSHSMQVPGVYANRRLWRNTTIASLPLNGNATLVGEGLGYEWDFEQAAYASQYPAGRVHFSATTEGGRTNHLALYRAPSGALVFGAGSVQWSWGLDAVHDRGSYPEDARMQQFTANLLAEMESLPTTLQGNLTAPVATGDVTPPLSAIGFPLDGGTVPSGVPVTVSGTAADAGGGVVGRVEVSVNGGTTWQPAAGGENWTFTWTPGAPGTANLRTRAADDLANLETPGAGITVTIGPAPPPDCPCTIWNQATVPGTLDAGDATPIEVGVKFRSDLAGEVTGVRFYKGPLNGGTHVGKLWSATGDLLGTATFTGETASGWQEVSFGTPIAIAANTTYIASVFLPQSHYSFDINYFLNSGTDNPPLHALQNGVDGPNAVYLYTPTGGFPISTFSASNYWVDVVFDNEAGPDTTPPVIVAITPGNGAAGVAVGTMVTATFNEAMDAQTITSANVELRDPLNALVPALVSYIPASRQAVLDPMAALDYSTEYTAQVSGAVTDVAGNPLGTALSWSFMTAAAPPPPPDEGPGGPILVIATAANPFGRYYAEILRCEGLNAFTVTDISLVTPAVLAAHDVAILAEMPPLTAGQATLLSDWVTNDGGNLIVMRPDPQLETLCGVSAPAGTLANAYLAIDTGTISGAGLVAATIQFHGDADLRTLAGATAIATLYSSATQTTVNPAVTRRTVGVNGGEVITFAYDLARSIVYTRQGNPAWAGQERDGEPTLRSDDMFFGNAAGDPQPDWIDLNKVDIPQADEQQRFLAQIILAVNADRKPLPRFWYLPRDLKAAVVMTGDEHATGASTVNRFNTYLAQSPGGCSLPDWECVRASSYIFPGAPGMTDAQAIAFHNQGFEIGAHINTGCSNWTPASLASDYTNQLAALSGQLPSIPPPSTTRTHCIAWSDWASQPEIELNHGIRMDVNYYYWPPGWVANRPGMFTGSGMPMRFAKTDGSMIDCYQATSQMTDESGQSYPFTIDVLLDRALGTEGYYGVFTANMHTDFFPHPSSDAIVASALARDVPVVSGRQMLEWLDGRNGSSFADLAWNGSVLSFEIEVGAGANRLRAMLPSSTAAGVLLEVTRNSIPLVLAVQTVKGVEYAFFDALPGEYEATYAPDLAGPVISSLTATPLPNGTSTITWTTDETANSRVDYGTTPALGTTVSASALVTSHSLQLTGLGSNTTYYYRATSQDASLNSSTAPNPPDPPAQFTMPAVACFEDDLAADFAAGTPGSATYVSITGNGELTLRPTEGTELSGTAVPAGWEAVPYGGGGQAVVAGGVITLDGHRFNPSAAPAYGPGRALEFVATFNGGVNQHVGFGNTLNEPTWALVSTGGGDPSQLRSRTWDGATFVDQLLPGGLIGAPHRYRIEWESGVVRFYVDGVLANTHTATIAGLMRPIAGDGPADGNAFTVDWIRMSPYPAAGTFLSRIFDAGGSAEWGVASWTSATPAGTSLVLTTRTGDTAVPDGSWTAFIPLAAPGADVPGNSRYIQYQAELATTAPGVTPELLAMTLTCDGESDVTPPVISNVTTANTTQTATDVTWDTDEAATSLVSYGTTPALGASASSPGLVLDHTVQLMGLAPNTLYYYRVTSADAATNSATFPATPDPPLTFTTAPAPAVPCFTDDLTADFLQGATGGTTYVSETDDGELILAPTAGSEFFGNSLPVGWNDTTWTAGGTTTVIGGVLTVDGTRPGTATYYTAGRSLEFEATFGAAAFQHAGFALTYNSALDQWAMFSTFGGGGGLYARTRDAGFTETNTLIPGSFIGTSHRYRIDWGPTSIVYSIDGTPVVTHNLTINAGLRPLVSDFNSGGAVLTLRWLRMGPYPAAGTFESRIADAGTAADWGAATWISDTPAGTSLSVSVRTGNTPSPDGSWTAFLALAGSGADVPGNSRYIQYRAELATTDPARTPALAELAIACTTTPDGTPPVITNVAADPDPSGTQAEITWDTDEPANSLVSYGTTPALGLTESSPAFVVAHSVELAGLTPNTLYHYRVTSADAAANSATYPVTTDPPLTFVTPPAPPAACFTDDLASEFGAGTTGAATHVAQAGDGEVILLPTAGSEFSGTGLPAGWSSSPWGGGGTAIVGGGLLTMNGAFASTDAFFGPGRSVEFVATFAATQHQHAGLGNDFNSFLFAIFSTGVDGATLKARATNGSPESVVDLGAGYFGAPHRYRIDWNATNVVYSIDGTTVATLGVTIASNMRPAVSDLNVGGAVLVVDWLRLTPYPAAGSFLSRIGDAGTPVTWATASWASTEPAGTSLALLVRTGSTPVPDGSWSAFTALSNGGAIGASARYIQYRADLATTDPARTPELLDVTLNCSACDPTPPAPVANLVATSAEAGNGDDGTTAIALTFTAPADATEVEIYRAPFGNYPEYDDGLTPGGVPSAPTYPPGAPWVLTAVTASGQIDDPGVRDVFYYTLFSRDACELVSPVSNMTTGTLSYRLGDVSDGATPGVGDNVINLLDISAFADSYGIAIDDDPDDDPNYLDVGPTTDGSVDGRPLTDNLIDFEDLVLGAINFDGVVARGAQAKLELPGAKGELAGGEGGRQAPVLELQTEATPDGILVRLLVAGGGEVVKAIHARIAYDAAALALTSVEPGALLGDAPSFFRHLDENGTAGVHAAILGRGWTLGGDGEVARLRFIGHGSAALALGDLRDLDNRHLGDPPAPTGVDPAAAPLPTRVELLPARPNPFNPSTLIQFRLPAAGPVRLRIYDVAGHLVRTLVDGPAAAGDHRAVWDGRRDGGRSVGSGVYVVQLIAGGDEHTAKLQLLK